MQSIIILEDKDEKIKNLLEEDNLLFPYFSRKQPDYRESNFLLSRRLVAVHVSPTDTEGVHGETYPPHRNTNHDIGAHLIPMINVLKKSPQFFTKYTKTYNGIDKYIIDPEINGWAHYFLFIISHELASSYTAKQLNNFFEEVTPGSILSKVRDHNYKGIERKTDQEIMVKFNYYTGLLFSLAD